MPKPASAEANWNAGVRVANVPSPPRVIPEAQVRMLLRRHSWIMTGMVVLWVGSLVGYYLLHWDGLRQDLAFATSEVDTTSARVLSHEKTSNTINNYETTRIHYAYDVDGESYTGAYETIDAQLLAKLSPGATLTVEIAGEQPWASRLPGKKSSFFGLPDNLLFLAMALFMPPIGLMRTRNLRRRKSRLLVHGHAAKARVTRRGRTSGKNKRHYADYEYSVAAVTYTGTILSGSQEHVNRMAPHDDLVIVYDSTNPGDSTLWAPAQRDEL